LRFCFVSFLRRVAHSVQLLPLMVVVMMMMVMMIVS
jgi:hypothetical protein